jgi:hypothetical protein
MVRRIRGEEGSEVVTAPTIACTRCDKPHTLREGEWKEEDGSQIVSLYNHYCPSCRDEWDRQIEEARVAQEESRKWEREHLLGKILIRAENGIDPELRQWVQEYRKLEECEMDGWEERT